MNTYRHNQRLYLRLMLIVCLAIAILMGTVIPMQDALAANPAIQQTYYVSLPEDDLLQLFDDNDAPGGTFPDPVSPIRSITSISIGSTGTWVYYDQWEPDNGGNPTYEADLRNPTDIYSTSNLNGTQIWGDGVLANGCPPSINNVPNPCVVASDDQLNNGDVIILDNEVRVDSVADQFESVSYTNNDGTQNWKAGWTDSEDGSPSSGLIEISGGELEFDGSTGTNPYIQRSVDLSALSSASFGFDIDTNNLENTDTFQVLVSSSSSGPFTVLETFSDDQTRSNSYDLSGFISSDTTIRFQVSGGTTGTSEFWYIDNLNVYFRDPQYLFYDGKDKFGASFPVAVTRGAFPISPGSVMAGGSEVIDTSRWGSSYESPLGEDSLDSNTDAFEDVRWFIMAHSGGATIDVDANGDGDVTDTNDLNNFVMAEGDKVQVDGILMGATLSVVSGNPVQVNLMAADVDDTFEFRWGSLLPRTAWSNDYYTPVGTAPQGSSQAGCTEVEVYNPNASTITINYDFPGGSSPDGTFTVAAGNTATGLTTPSTPLVQLNDGGRYWSQGGEDFLPFSVTDCTRGTSSGRIFDWGNPIFPADQLTDQVLVGWAPGCSNESLLGICEDADITTNSGSRSVVWVTPLADTILYVDTDGSGVNCSASPVTGAEQVINPANALVSYRIDDDPTSSNKVRDDFGSVSYSNQDGDQNWATNWIETGDNGAPGSGSILITGGTLRITGAGSIGDTIEREVNLSGQIFADLTFELTSSGTLDPDDELAVDISDDGGSTWRNLRTYLDDPATNVKAIIISTYNASNTRIRFRQVNDLSTGEFWNIDQVQVKYAADGDYDMTGARILTCDGTAFASAWGQDPARSGGNDDEALDMGTGITPLGSDITLVKSGDKTTVAVGGPVTYTYEVNSLGGALSGVAVTDNKCSPAVYTSGDTNGDDLLNTDETWIFTCTSNIFVDTTNVAFASSTSPALVSAPDEWTVTVIQPAVIGNYVWLDEDGDGDQDAGEAGIPNVLVTLTGNDSQGNPINVTAYTDANGGYLFDGLPPSDGSGYTITVSPLSGLNQTYDPDATVDNATTVVVAAGDEFMDADFGYNWSTPTETGDPDTPPPSDATGAIGDRVWIDADGDGVQDPGEAGLGGVTVTLLTAGPDGLFGTGDDVTAGTTTTAPDGTYIFDDLDPDAYVVQVTPPGGYTQTGDPDETLDNQTTDPVLLGPGDVFVNADFGYNPDEPGSDIGDTVWFDYDADGVQDAGEPGVPGVSVALVLDDGDGLFEPGVDQIIATDITDENGLYLFPDLPAGTYFVTVTDTENVLGESAPTYDADGGLDELSLVTVDGINNDLDQDFGYAPPGQDPGEGLIGDQIWLDDGDGLYEPGEGLEGVRVVLTDPGPDGVLGTSDDIARETFSDENGYYSFGNLEPSLSYQVTVDPTTLPPGVTNTIDPDGTNDSTTVRNLSVTGPIDLGTDFAYQVLDDPNTISGTIWEDTNADGTLTEPGRFPGVTVVLRDNSGNIIAATTTDSNGDYFFTNLPDGTYSVDVTDDFNVLDGYWHSDGPNDGADNNSQDDPYTVTVTGGQTDTTGDFGYYQEPAAVGNIIWDDLNDNGIQDPGEPGIPGVKVTLTITYPNGDVVTLSTTTDSDGFYSFDNLLQDEDYDGSGSVEPTYSLTVEIPGGYTVGLTDVGTDDFDSDGVETVDGSFVVIGPSPNSALVMGEYNPDYDFGFTSDPTNVDPVTNFKADYYLGDIRLSWVTENPELMNVVYVEMENNEQWVRLATVPTEGKTYHEWIHQDTQPGVEYTYRLFIPGRNPLAVGPVSLRGPYSTYLPIINY